MVTVGRHINGITINPLEYLLDESGNLLAFENEEHAKRFLKSKGFSEDDIYWLAIDDCMVKCLNCGHEFVLNKLSRDKLGWHTACPKCNGSFDVDIADVEHANTGNYNDEAEKNACPCGGDITDDCADHGKDI